MARCLAGLLLVSLATAAAQQSAPAQASGNAASDAQIALHTIQQDAAVGEALQALAKDTPTDYTAFRNINLVDPVAGQIVPDQTVIVWGDQIAWVGDAAKEPERLKKAPDLASKGLYLAPGLADMHVHLSRAGSWLLELDNGITMVREMAGFPWMIRARSSVDAGTMLAPKMAVAGPLLTYYPLEGYAVLVQDPLSGRHAVRQEAACGYDFIKVWNIVPQPVFDAIAEQSRIEGMDLVGHVPHDISVAHAVQSGMRTMEHLKGFINDATLQRGETDYAAAVGDNIWNTPTLYEGRPAPRGEEGRAILKSNEMKYVPLRRRDRWAQGLDKPEDHGQKLRDGIGPMGKDIVKELHALHAHFLAGTDSDENPFQVAGFALLDELKLLQDAGLSPAEAIRAATTEAARALREPDEFGQIQKKMRADLILLESNPLQDLSAFRHNRGVMAHGVWLSRDKLDAALAKLAQVYGEPDRDVAVSETDFHAAADRVESLQKTGFVIAGPELADLADQARSLKFPAEAERFDRLANIPKHGPCAELRPQ